MWNYPENILGTSRFELPAIRYRIGLAMTPQRPMQHFTVKDCIRAPVPYLSHPLKMDNLPLICKHVSENVLHAILVH